MFYEERWIDGVLHYRTNPRDQFRPMEDMEKWVNDKLAALREQIARYDAVLDAAPPPEGAAQGRDTERLNWLASNADRLHRHPNTGEWYVGQWHDIDTRGYPHAGVQLYESARQAIDAALATLPAAPKQEP